MKIFAIVLFAVLALLQLRLWLSDDGVREVGRLERAVAGQQEENASLKARNDRLAAEVRDLKEGMTAVEERARSDLGMVGANESFYQVVPPEKEAATTARSEPRPDAESVSADARREAQGQTRRDGTRPAAAPTTPAPSVAAPSAAAPPAAGQ